MRTAERRRGIFAALWTVMFRASESRELALRPTLQEGLDRYEEHVELLEARVSVGADLEPIRAARPSPVAIVGLAAAIVGVVGAGIKLSDGDVCRFSDGTSADGRCEFIEEFHGDVINQVTWTIEQDMYSALVEHGVPYGCAVLENATQSGGTLHLRFSAGALTPCPQSWTPSAYYNLHFGAGGDLGNFPAPTNTAYKTSAVSQKQFKTRYGHFIIRAKMPGGTSPWGGILLWGENCQAGGALSALMTGFFNHDGPCLWPDPGSSEFDIPSYVHAQTDGKQGIMALHVGPANGAPFLRNYYGVPYYGIEAAPNLPGYQPFVTSVDFGVLSDAFHVYELYWVPNQFTALIDGQITLQVNHAWVPSEKMFIQLWNVDNSGVVADLPQDMVVDYVRVVCPPGVPCEWTGGL